MPDKYRNPVTTTDEDRERDLNSNRAFEQHEARIAAIARLADRGINADDASSVETIADLLEAVEAFERAVEMNGGDLMVDSPPSNEPDDPRFMMPHRRDDESISAFTNRVRLAADRLLAGS